MWMFLLVLALLAPAVRPVPGPVVREFDPPAVAYGAGHRGVDLAAAPGTVVLAALDGTVFFAGPVGGATWVTLDHGEGLRTTYGELAGLRVTAGERVAAGAPLGVLAPGRTHLDWGARRGPAYVDPLSLLGGWEVALAEDLPPPTAAVLRTWPVGGRVSSGFGVRVHPITGGRRVHRGIDIAAPAGTVVVAAGDGVVVAAGWGGGYGNRVVLDHGGGVTTLYGHADALLVRVGQRVGAGTPVARVGSTGASTGPHLHFEVRRDGVPVDPRSAY